MNKLSWTEVSLNILFKIGLLAFYFFGNITYIISYVTLETRTGATSIVARPGAVRTWTGDAGTKIWAEVVGTHTGVVRRETQPGAVRNGSLRGD